MRPDDSLANPLFATNGRVVPILANTTSIARIRSAVRTNSSGRRTNPRPTAQTNSSGARPNPLPRVRLYDGLVRLKSDPLRERRHSVTGTKVSCRVRFWFTGRTQGVVARTNSSRRRPNPWGRGANELVQRRTNPMGRGANELVRRRTNSRGRGANELARRRTNPMGRGANELVRPTDRWCWLLGMDSETGLWQWSGWSPPAIFSAAWPAPKTVGGAHPTNVQSAVQTKSTSGCRWVRPGKPPAMPDDRPRTAKVAVRSTDLRKSRDTWRISRSKQPSQHPGCQWLLRSQMGKIMGKGGGVLYGEFGGGFFPVVS